MARKDDALEQSGTDQFQETDRSSHRTHLASTVAARSQTGSCLVEEASISEMRSAEKCICSYLKGGTFALDWRSGAIELSRGQRIRVGGEIYSEELASRRVAGVQAGPLGLGEQTGPRRLRIFGDRSISFLRRKFVAVRD